MLDTGGGEASARNLGEFRPDGTHRIGRYWDAAEVAAEAAGTAGPDLREVIEESVRAHLIADVPVSSFLSGGLDSSIVTVLAKQARTEIDAYTITFRPEDQRLEAMPDDAIYARKVADKFGIKLHEIQIAPDVVELLPRMVGILDEPIGDAAAINTLLMCEAARDAGVKVILSGMGADELFGGYRKHVACTLSSQYQRLPGAARSATRAAVMGLPVSARGRGLRYSRWAKRFLTFSELPEEAAFRRSYSLYDPIELDRPSRRGPRSAGRRRDGRARRPLLGQSTRRSRQPDVPGGQPALPARASTSPTPTGRAWPPRPRSGCRSWTRQCSRPRSP